MNADVSVKHSATIFSKVVPCAVKVQSLYFRALTPSYQARRLFIAQEYGITVFTRVIHALFLTKILYLNLGCAIYARIRFYVNKSGYTGNFLNIVLKA